MIRFILTICICLASANLQGADSIQQIEQLIAQRDFAGAATQGAAMLQKQPGHTRARFLTAYAYQMSAQPKAAEALYQELIRDNPGLPEPRNNLAMIYLAQGDYDRASQLLVEAINTHSSYATAYENLSRIYTGIASEAYRRAISESDEPAKYMHDIELAAITQLDSIDQVPAEDDSSGQATAINFANQETLLIERLQLWARAWSDKDFPAYSSFYAPQHKARFDSHEQWLAHRRERILRPGSIKVQVSDIQIKWRSENRAIIDFKQAFDSPRYSDRVVKRIGFSRFGAQWKITEERVLSVL